MNFDAISSKKLAFNAILLVIVVVFLVSLSSLLFQDQGGQEDIVRQKGQIQDQKEPAEKQEREIVSQQIQPDNHQTQDDQAKQKQADQRGEPLQKQPADFSTEELQKYVEARNEAEKIEGEYVEELRHVAESRQAWRIRDEYTRQMNEVIENHGLSIKKYYEIRESIENSPELQEKLDKLER